MKAFDNYRQLQFEKAINLSESAPTLEEVLSLSLEKLYPEFGITETENVGYFDPFCSGSLETGTFDSVLEIGQGASVLTLLPFHSKVIVHVDRIPEAKFQRYYGVDFKSFRKLIDAGRILPILTNSIEPYSMISGEWLTHLEPLFLEGHPSDDRQFLALRQATIRDLESERYDSISRSTKKLIRGVLDLFQTSRFQGSYLIIGNRSIYRGQPILLLLWAELASRGIKSLEPIAEDLISKGLDRKDAREGIEDIVTFMLDTRDRIFESSLLVPGTVVSYSRPVFNWLQHEMKSLTRLLELNHADLHISELRALRKLSYLPGATAIDELAILKNEFVYEPIEAAGDMDKYIHWLEHSAN
jgi:hypothetical protein